MNELSKRIWEISRELPVLEKDKPGYKFKYVDLDTIVETLEPLLKKHKLGYVHQTSWEDGKNMLITQVFQLDGQETQSTVLAIPDGVSLGGMNPYQSLGSALTYFRRYNLITIFDIIADTDVDAVKPQIKPKSDWVKRIKENIAKGVDKAQLEAWYSKNRGLMTEEQRTVGFDLINAMRS